MSQEELIPLRSSRRLDTPSVSGSPGAYLRQVRESRHLTQEDVALRLRLSSYIINAIENDDYQKMADPMFVRGYLRSYARLFELPEDAIIQGFNQLIGSAAPRPLSRVSPAAYGCPDEEKASRPTSSLLRWFISLAVLLGVLMLVQWWMMENPDVNLMAQIRTLFSA